MNCGLTGKVADFNSTLAVKIPVSIHDMKVDVGAGLSAKAADLTSGQFTVGGRF